MVSVECSFDVGRGRAPETCPLVEWLISATSAMEEPVHFIGCDLTPSAAVRVGWSAAKAKRCDHGVCSPSWSFRSGLGIMGFQQPDPEATSPEELRNTF